MSGESIRLVQVEKLSRLIREKRDTEDLTLEEIANVTGISASTLSRLERYSPNEKKSINPDTRTVTALVQWLNVPLESVLDIQIQSPQQTVEGHLKAVEAHLRANKNLDAESMRLINSIMSLAYEQATQTLSKASEHHTESSTGN